jgi:phospholipid/cholesterol/gamma-HCH transport system substrate-binding protein
MKSTEFKVGILIIIALVVLFFGYRWLAETQFGQRKYMVKVLFPDAGGLLIGDNALVVGVKQGKVRKINLVGREVEVVFSLDKKVTLYSDAHFSIMDVAFVSGTKYLRVDPGTSGIPLDLTKPARGDATASLSMARLSVITVSLVEILGMVQTKLLNEEMVSSVSNSIKNLETFSAELTTLVQESGGNLKQGMQDFADASAKLNKTMNSKELESTLKRLDTISARLDTLSIYLTSDETSVGKLLREDHLYEDTRETLALMQALLEDFKENPKKYINLKIF